MDGGVVLAVKPERAFRARGSPSLARTPDPVHRAGGSALRSVARVGIEPG